MAFENGSGPEVGPIGYGIFTAIFAAITCYVSVPLGLELADVLASEDLFKDADQYALLASAFPLMMAIGIVVLPPAATAHFAGEFVRTLRKK